MTDDSDVDILIEFDRPIGAFELLDLQEDLERMLGRPVDLVTPAAVKERMPSTFRPHQHQAQREPSPRRPRARAQPAATLVPCLQETVQSAQRSRQR